MDIEKVRASLLEHGWSPEGTAFLLSQADTYDGARILARFGGPHPGRRPAYKKDIPEALRWWIWARDQFTCQQCGARQFLSIDHIIPECQGGTLDPDNLQTLCGSCNSRKGHR